MMFQTYVTVAATVRCRRLKVGVILQRHEPDGCGGVKSTDLPTSFSASYAGSRPAASPGSTQRNNLLAA